MKDWLWPHPDEEAAHVGGFLFAAAQYAAVNPEETLTGLDCYGC